MFAKDIFEAIGAKLVERTREAITNKQVTQFGSVNASGRLANSVRYEATETRLTVYANDYLYYVQFGRRNGKFPPRNAIEFWLDNKQSAAANFGWNEATDSQKRGIVFVISRAIAEKGTTIYQQGGSDLLTDIFTPELVQEIKLMLLNFAKTEVRSILFSER
jgi:hypothetical protein